MTLYPCEKQKHKSHTECIVYHKQVVEQEDFSLVDAAPLSSVWIGNLEQLTAAHQPAMRQRQHLQHTHRQTHTSVTYPVSKGYYVLKKRQG